LVVVVDEVEAEGDEGLDAAGDYGVGEKLVRNNIHFREQNV
jgi:hypothetical protein